MASLHNYQRRAQIARRFARVLAVGLCLLIGLPLVLHLTKYMNCLGLGGQCGRDDGYAAEYFRDLTPIAAVLASRRDTTDGSVFDRQKFKCSYAIADLDSNAPKIPPASRLSGREDMKWGGGWRSATTLSPQQSEDLRSLLAVCSENWSDKVQERLIATFSDRRALISGRAPYRQINLYLPPSDVAGLAARIRFGD